MIATTVLRRLATKSLATVGLGALLMMLGGCQTPHESAGDLSMRFTHPELFESRWWFPREEALSEMQRLGLLRRGMAADVVHHLLGWPNRMEDYDGETVRITDNRNLVRLEPKVETKESSEPPKEVWIYDELKRSQLYVEFDRSTRKVRRFCWSFEEAEGHKLNPDVIW
jgi:hypothetical protein